MFMKVYSVFITILVAFILATMVITNSNTRAQQEDLATRLHTLEDSEAGKLEAFKQLADVDTAVINRVIKLNDSVAVNTAFFEYALRDEMGNKDYKRALNKFIAIHSNAMTRAASQPSPKVRQ